MYEDGKRINRHTNVIRHKRRLKDIEWTFLSWKQKKLVNKKADKWLVTDFYKPHYVKWWNSIYDSWINENRFSKKTNTRKLRNYYKRQIEKYLADDEFDYNISRQNYCIGW